jgi:hypothetical protein
MEAGSTILIVINAGCPRKHKFKQEQNTFRKDIIVTKGPLKRLSGTQIIDMLDKLMLDPERPSILKVMKRHTIGIINVHCGSFCTWLH